MDRQAIIEAYEDVRSDQTPTSWALFGFDDSDKIVLICSGNDNSEFLEKIADDQRQFVFVRVTTGDELSKRAKFAFISWIGENVAALKRAKMTQARSLIKEVVKSFSAEISPSDKDEITEEKILQEVKRAGGANYGTGM